MAQGVGERSQGPHAASHSSRRAALAPPGTRRALQVAVGCHSRASPLPRMQQTQGSLRHSVSHQGTRAVAPLSLCYLGRSLGVVDPLFPHRVLKSSFRSWPTCRILFDDLPPPNPPSPKPPPYREGSHEGYVHDIHPHRGSHAARWLALLTDYQHGRTSPLPRHNMRHARTDLLCAWGALLSRSHAITHKATRHTCVAS